MILMEPVILDTYVGWNVFGQPESGYSIHLNARHGFKAGDKVRVTLERVEEWTPLRQAIIAAPRAANRAALVFGLPLEGPLEKLVEALPIYEVIAGFGNYTGTVAGAAIYPTIVPDTLSLFLGDFCDTRIGLLVLQTSNNDTWTILHALRHRIGEDAVIVCNQRTADAWCKEFTGTTFVVVE